MCNVVERFIFKEHCRYDYNNEDVVTEVRGEKSKAIGCQLWESQSDGPCSKVREKGCLN
jgi:hypothetical protein